MANYSKELKQHLIENEHIREVHFDAAGNHFFNVHDINGRKYSQVVTDFHGGLRDEQASEPFLIIESVSRDEVLGKFGPVINTTAPEVMEAINNLPDSPAPDSVNNEPASESNMTSAE